MDDDSGATLPRLDMTDDGGGGGGGGETAAAAVAPETGPQRRKVKAPTHKFAETNAYTSLSQPRTPYTLWKAFRAKQEEMETVAFGAAKPGLPLTKDGWKQVLPEDRVPFERESKGEYEAFAAAGGNLSKKASATTYAKWTDGLVELVEGGEEGTNPTQLYIASLPEKDQPPADAPTAVLKALWSKLHRDEKSKWRLRSKTNINKRRKTFKDAEEHNWTDSSSMNSAAQLAVVQEAMLTCSKEPDKVNPVDAMLDVFMSTVPALIGLLGAAHEGTDVSQSMGRLAAQPLLLPGVAEFWETLPFLKTDQNKSEHSVDSGYWEEANAPDGRTYWFNRATGASRWDKPAGM